jgi:hypothetical protein
LIDGSDMIARRVGIVDTTGNMWKSLLPGSSVGGTPQTGYLPTVQTRSYGPHYRRARTPMSRRAWRWP